MPQPDTTTTGAPCWIDLSTSDPAASRDFYGSLFGWGVIDPGPDYGGYVNFTSGDQMVGGCMQAQPGSPDTWTVYLRTPDIAATVARAVGHGGQVMVPAMEVMTLGSMAVFVDPGQAVVGAWQPGDHAGFGVVDEVNAPSWFELHTGDYAAAVAFYRDVFGWDAHTMSDAPEFRYTTLGGDDDQQAGIMDATVYQPEGPTAGWVVYFRVADTDAALARTVELGGTVIQPAEDTPYGRIAVAADPNGASFRLRALP